MSDIHRAAREFRAIANLLSGAVPWTEHARLKAEEYAEYFEGLEKLASHAPSAPIVADGKNAEALIWAVERWNLEVRNRPIRNVHYRTLDETWRQVMRHFGGDPDELVGPPPQYSAPSEAAAQPTEGQRLYAAYKRDEIEHNDH